MEEEFVADGLLTLAVLLVDDLAAASLASFVGAWGFLRGELTFGVDELVLTGFVAGLEPWTLDMELLATATTLGLGELSSGLILVGVALVSALGRRSMDLLLDAVASVLTSVEE